MDKSPIDELFYSLYRFYPSKAGKAYELLVAAAIKIMTGKKVEPDQHVRGEFSKSDYQVDGILFDDKGPVMIEAKDYTKRDARVGRNDLLTMQGALTELNFIRGVFASATDFTAPARKYAKSTAENPAQKLIDIYHIRPSTKADEKGRIMSIELTMSMLIARHDLGQFQPALTMEAREEFRRDGFIANLTREKIESFYNSDGSLFMTISDFTRNNQPIGEIYETLEANGCWVLTDKAVKINGKCYGIKGVEYRIPYTKSDKKFTIEVEGNPKILIRSEDGSIDKLLTDEELRQMTFE